MSSHGSILNGAQQNPTQILKRTIIGTFHQSLVKIGQAVSEELMKMNQFSNPIVYLRSHMTFNIQLNESNY